MSPTNNRLCVTIHIHDLYDFVLMTGLFVFDPNFHNIPVPLMAYIVNLYTIYMNMNIHDIAVNITTWSLRCQCVEAHVYM